MQDSLAAANGHSGVSLDQRTGDPCACILLNASAALTIEMF